PGAAALRGRRGWLPASIVLAPPAAATESLADPAFAVRTGYACQQCHLNRTGGGMRTSFGGLYGQLTLPQHLLRWRDGENLLPEDPEARIAFRADARFPALVVSRSDRPDGFSFAGPEAHLSLRRPRR